MRALVRTAALGVLVAGLAGPVVAAPVLASAAPSMAASAAATSRACPPSGRAIGYSDALDKLTRDGVTLGGLSDLDYDPATRSFASTVDNDGTEPARVWFYRDPLHPRLTRDPLVLKQPDGTPYTGEDADDEGLAVLPGGRFLVSSETEPAIRVFGRQGRQRASLPVPQRFRVAPAGQATANATLEGLTVSPDGTRVVAAMEGTLRGDVAPGTDPTTATYRRMAVYHRGPGGFTLAKQVGYRVQPGNRIAEVQAYPGGGLLVLEASFSPTTGNTVELYAVRDLGTARDVSRVPNLATRPGRVVAKRLVADVTACPTLGATSEEAQANPLLDNYEGMHVGDPARHGPAGHRYRTARVTLLSDDNFSEGQKTRLLTLSVRLP